MGAVVISYFWHGNRYNIEFGELSLQTVAFEQIKEKNYPTILKNRNGSIILVGINYDEKTKVHSCKIETVTK